MSPQLLFHLLGPWELLVDGRQLPRPSTLKAQSLLAYLLVQSGTAQPREKLAGLLWPDADDDRAQRSLRTALWSLRRLLEEGHPRLAEAVIASRFDVRWAPSFPVEIDAVQFEAAAQHGLASLEPDAFASLQEAAALYRGPLLEGLYDDWCLNERYRLEERYLQVLEGLVAGYEAAGLLREAVAAAHRLLGMDPLREETHRAVIRLLGAMGDRAGAARQFARCTQLLHDELGVAPSAETQAAFEAARTMPVVAPRRSPDQSALAASPALPAVSPPASAHLPPAGLPLIGRRAQWDALAGWLQAAEAGRGHTFLIAAEAGCGKTRLLEEVAARARWRSMRVLWGRCYEYERVLPYQPFAEALRTGIQPSHTVAVGDHLRAADPARLDAPSDAATLAALPPIWQQALLLLLPDWSDRLHPFSEVPKSEKSGSSFQGPLAMRPGEEQSQILEAISQLLYALARGQPLLLVIDDLHWAAESTLQLFHHIARGVARHPILLLGSYRPEDLAPVAEDAGSQPPLLRVSKSLQALGLLELLTLEPFSRDQVEELIAHVAGVAGSDRGQPPPAVRPRLAALADGVHRYAEGNPLFVLAALDALGAGGASNGLLKADAAGISLAGVAAATPSAHVPEQDSDRTLALPLPPQIRELLEDRLNRVSATAREIARLASVAGSEFDLAILERAWGQGEEETLRAIDVLLAARFFREGAARDFSFTHHLYKEVIYDGLPRAARARHHRRIAEAMVAVYGPRALSSELALHFARGELPVQALRHAHRAGDQAAAGYANDDAIAYYSMALSQLAQAQDGLPADQRAAFEPERIDLIEARIGLYRRLGRPREEEADVQAMLTAARAAGDRRREIQALIHRSYLHSRAANTDQALDDAREALALARALPSAGYAREVCIDLEARAQTSLGGAHLLRNAYTAALDAFEHALSGYRSLKAAADRSGQAALSGEAVTLYRMGLVHERTGDYTAARRHYEEALAIYRAAGDRLGQANTAVYLGNICWFAGDLAGAQARYEEALALYGPIVYRRGEATALRSLGLTLWRRGRLEDALGYHRRALALHEALEDPAGVAECQVSIADCHYLLGRYAEALSGYEHALALTRAAGNSHGEAQSLFGCSRVERALGRPEQALSRIAAARPRCEAIGDRRGLAWCDREEGLAELDLGHPDAARALLAAALEGFSALNEPSLRTATAADLARALIASGNTGQALALAREAAAALQTSDHGVEQPQAVLLTIAQALQAAGDAAARTAWSAAAAEVEAQAARLADAELRASFLEAVPVNQAIRSSAISGRSVPITWWSLTADRPPAADGGSS